MQSIFESNPPLYPVPAPASGRPLHSSHRRHGKTRWDLIALVAGLHGAVLFALMQVDVVRATVAQAVPMFVTFIALPAPEPLLAPPRPVARPAPQPRLLAAPTPTPAAIEVAPPDPEPAPVTFDAPPSPPVVAPPAPAKALPETIPADAVRYLERPPPPYPSQSIRNHEAGTVLLRVLISASGLPEQVLLARSSGFERLDKAALQWVRHRFRFVPAQRNGRAVPVYASIPISFSFE